MKSISVLSLVESCSNQLICVGVSASVRVTSDSKLSALLSTLYRVKNRIFSTIL